MKTTIDIADSLINEARRVAAREGTTLRDLFEEGLRRVLRDRNQAQRFQLRKVTFGGRGLQPEFHDAGWNDICEAIHRDRGA